MATRDFEVQQLLKAYRKGLISDELLEAQMKELGAAKETLNVANVFEHRGKSSEVSAKMLQKTPQSQTLVFTVPAGFSVDQENTHKGDEVIYVIEGGGTVRVSGKEQEVKAGDVLMIPAGSAHTLRTGGEPLFGFATFAPPEEGLGG